ncbi:MAG: imm11 family protein [Thermodesulfobacteriota bacterium]
MRIYIVQPDVNKYRGLYYTDSKDVVEFNRRFNGTPMKNTWNLQDKFEFVSLRLPKGDVVGLSSHIPVFGARAVELLGDLLEGNGELLPITVGGVDYFVFNVTRVIDALDEANSEVDRFESGEIFDVDRYSFFPEPLEDATVFKIPHAVLQDVFVTNPFVERVQEAKLKGFKFRMVWSSAG